MIECYAPFSWYEPMWMESLGIVEAGEGWKLTESGATGGAVLRDVGRIGSIGELDRDRPHAGRSPAFDFVHLHLAARGTVRGR